MGLSWIRVDVDMVDHPKVQRLAKAMGDPNAGWYLVRALCWCARYAPSGVIRPEQLEAFETAVRGLSHTDRWSGRLLSQMTASGLLDALQDGSREVHGWSDRQSKAAEIAANAAERQRKRRSVTRDIQCDKPSYETRRDGRDETDVTRRDDLAGSMKPNPPADAEKPKAKPAPQPTLPGIPEPPPKPRAQSWQEKLYEDFCTDREIWAEQQDPPVDPDTLGDGELPPAFINAAISSMVGHIEAGTIRSVAFLDLSRAFFAMPNAAAKGWPFRYFASKGVWHAATRAAISKAEATDESCDLVDPGALEVA